MADVKPIDANQRTESEIFRCSICGVEMGWQESDYEHGTMWECERCGATFCTRCAAKRIGGEAFNEMIQSGERVLCPACWSKTEG